MRDLSVEALLAAALMCGAASPAWADSDDGWAAYLDGDYASSLKEWRPPCRAGRCCSRPEQPRRHACMLSPGLYGVALNHGIGLGSSPCVSFAHYSELFFFL
jgi:hypothetical protein